MFGLSRNKAPERSIPIAYGNAAQPQPGQQGRAFRIELGWKGLLGLIVIFCILEMWMFFVGMWAAANIVFPTGKPAVSEMVAPGAAAPQTAARKSPPLPGSGQRQTEAAATPGSTDEAAADDGVMRGEAPPSW